MKSENIVCCRCGQIIRNRRVFAQFHAKIHEANGGEIDGRPVICLYLTVDGRPTILTGWNPLPCDILAEDWMTVD